MVVLPGSGCTPTRQCNFYDWFGRTVDAIEAADGTPKYRSIMKNMPDPHVCREKIWVPFVREELIPEGAAESTVVVGHSSGAVAAMRLAGAEQTARDRSRRGVRLRPRRRERTSQRLFRPSVRLGRHPRQLRIRVRGGRRSG